MSKSVPDKQTVRDAIRKAVNQAGGRRISRQDFLVRSSMKLSDILRHYDNWTEALSDAGFEFEPYAQKIEEENLLKDWGKVTRELRGIPTRQQYRRRGKYSTTVFANRFGELGSKGVEKGKGGVPFR